MSWEELPLWEKGIVIGGAILIVAILVFLICICVWYKKQRDADAASSPTAVHGGTAAISRPLMMMPTHEYTPSEMAPMTSSRPEEEESIIAAVHAPPTDENNQSVLVIPQIERPVPVVSADPRITVEDDGNVVDMSSPAPHEPQDEGDEDGDDTEWWKDPDMVEDFVKFRERGSRWNAGSEREARQRLGLEIPASDDELALRQVWFSKNFWKAQGNILIYRGSQELNEAWAMDALDGIVVLDDGRELERRRAWLTAQIAGP